MTDRPWFAHVQAWSAARAERRGAAAIRDWLAHDLHGHVVELGPGHGLQFVHYPPTVTRVTAVEPEATLRAMAARAPTTVPVDVVGGTAETIPLEDASVDAAVCAGVMCSVSDVDAVLDEITRVLVPGGVLRLYDHVRAHSRAAAAVQDIVDRSGLWARAMADCHLLNDPLTALHLVAGLTVTAADRFAFCPTPLDVLVAPKLLLAAQRRA